MEKKALHMLVLYMQCFLKKNRIEYYGHISEVRSKDNYEQWVKFFLSAVSESADDAAAMIHTLSHLHNENVKRIDGMGRSSGTTRKIFDYLEKNPIIDMRKTSDALGLSFSAVSAAVKRLEQASILVQTNNISRNRVYCYEEYMRILRKDTELC